MRTLATGLMWGEGVRSVGGAIWVSDTQASRLWTDAGSNWEHFDLRTASNGLWHVDGQLVAAMMHEPRIGVWDGAEFGTYADLSDVTSGPLGDMIGDAHGRLYVDDVGYALHRGEAPKPGRVLCVEQSGQCWVAAENLAFPNGLAFINEGTTLVVAETDRGVMTAFDVDEYGRLSNRRLYADITAVGPPGSRIDGIWPDGDGVWAALLTGEALIKVAPGGAVLDMVSTPGRFPIACCVTDDELLVTLASTDGTPLMEALAKRHVRASLVSFGLDRQPH